MLYNIVNPSDGYTIDCPDLEIATIACCLLGRGQYAFEPLEDSGVSVPLFLFGGVEAFCAEHFKQPFETVREWVMAHRTEDLAAALDSVIIGRYAEDRQIFYESAPTERDLFEIYRFAYHDRRRSSLNDIGGRAYAMAAKLRAGAANPVVPAPQQVFGQ